MSKISFAKIALEATQKKATATQDCQMFNQSSAKPASKQITSKTSANPDQAKMTLPPKTRDLAGELTKVQSENLSI